MPASMPDLVSVPVTPFGEAEPCSCWVLAETVFLDGVYAREEVETVAEIKELLFQDVHSHVFEKIQNPGLAQRLH